jgi:DNA-binding beta-propeller fold protein YncE
VGSISESGVSPRTSAIGAGIIAIALAALLWMAPGAQAAELIYWDNYGANPDNVAFANIDGTGGGLLNLGGQEVESPEGMAYDTVTNRLFVANSIGTDGQILAVNLDGSGAGPFIAPGAPIEEPEGVAVDPVTRTIYWANTKGEGSIAWANLDGGAGGVLNTTGATLKSPCCRLAIDPVGGRIYWVNSGATIGFANLNNTGGGGTLNLTGTTVAPGGEGIAVDSAAGRVYFLGGTNEIGYANVNGTGAGDVPTSGGAVNGPWGLALDPSIGRLYVGNESNGEKRENAIGFVGLGGGGGGISIATAPVANPQDPVIIKSPSGTETPKITRSKKSRSALSCSTGSWAADFVGSFVYRAPRAFAYQWTLKGKSLKGAVKATLQAKATGKYTCVVTASNQAGSAGQTSAALNVKAAKVKLTAKKKVSAAPGGVAKFTVRAANQGDLKSGNARVCVKISKKDKSDLKTPKCKSLGTLKGRGRRTATLGVKVGQGAAGAYKLTFLVRGSAGTSAKAKILVR